MPGGSQDGADSTIVDSRSNAVGSRAPADAAVDSPAPSAARDRRVLIAALLLTGLSMRIAVTSVGAVLSDVQTSMHTNSAVAGVITTLPAACFAVLGALAPRLASRAGPHRLLLLAMITMTAGLVSRAVVGTVWAFLALSVLSLAGAAVANVLMPMEVKSHFPNRIGSMTALYTTAMAIGTTAGAGLTVPIGSIAGGPDAWRLAIGSWAVLSAVAVLPWLAMARSDGHLATGRVRIRARMLARSRIAWMVTFFFAFQSLAAYVAFGWFERFLTEHSISDSTAGWMVALMSAMAIPTSMLAPTVPPRYHRPLVLFLSVCMGSAYAGMNLAPAASWGWMVLAGIGGGMFPLSLTLMGYRSATPSTTASLSAFAQGIGYTIAACGPVLFGILHGATGGWAAPFIVLWFALVAATVAGWRACVPRTVDDDLRSLAPTAR